MAAPVKRSDCLAVLEEIMLDEAYHVEDRIEAARVILENTPSEPEGTIGFKSS